MNICRVCKAPLHKKPLLTYRNMPKAAQYFPGADDLATEHGVDVTVSQCSGCGLVQLLNEPVEYYREVIRAAKVSVEVTEQKRKQFIEFIDKYSLHGEKVLEAGCGNGEFLSILDSLDVEAYGIEYGKDAVELCIKNKLRVQRQYLSENMTLKEGPFDAFLLLMFLEHMPDPNTYLKALYNNLNPGGVGIVEVPNFSMIIRDNLFSEFISDHLLYFTHETLKTCLEINGFNILECNEIRDDYVITAIVQKRPKLDISRFHDYQQKIDTDINHYIDRFTFQKVAVWGAGHQSLALITMTNIAGKLAYIVDSATFKQNKFSPATHVKIVAPEVLMDDDLEAVIVIGGSYSDEIVRIIKEKYPSSLSIAVMRTTGLEVIR